MKMPRDEYMHAIDDLLHDILGNHLRPPSPPSKEMNITLGQIHCIGEISRLGNPTMSELAAALGLHPSTVTVLVDGLVSHGLVVRRADPKDRRIVRVAETAKGRKNHEGHMAEMRARMARVLSELSDDDLDGIHDALGKLRDAARKNAEAEGRRPEAEGKRPRGGPKRNATDP